MKVYCKDCKYLQYIPITNSMAQYRYECNYSDNMIREYWDSWFEAEDDLSCLNAPEEINKNNDCKWYKEKK